MTPYDLAYEYAMHTNRCVFLTGKAGTGKTTFLRNLRMQCPKQIAVVAPTGVAAINAEGVTIHSLFQLPPQVFLPTAPARKALFQEMQMREQKRKVLKNLELLVIDEVSMVRADLLDTIDVVLRHFKHRPNLPFGGVQMLFIGDLYQLSPVAKHEDWELMREWYEGPYFFQARVIKEITPLYIELDHVFRQTNEEFIDILNHVRNNTLSQEGLNALNRRYSDNPQLDQSILLSTHNHKVDSINSREMEKLQGKTYTYNAEIRHTFPESMFPMDAVLNLKVGAKVMFIKNDSSPEKRYFNGKLGKVTALATDEIKVTCDDGQVIDVKRETWENIRYVTNGNSDAIQTEIAGTFSHFPLRLAWAITIHKAQGLTFDRVIIDAEDAFASGQVYVALSRCRSLEGITLTSKIPGRALTNAREVVQFTQNQLPINQVEQLLVPSESDYFLHLLIGLYDFMGNLHHVERLQHICKEDKSFNQAGASDFVNGLSDTLAEWQNIAESFHKQLQKHLLTTPTTANIDQLHEQHDFLKERLQAAFEYFNPQISEFIKRLQSSSVRSEKKESLKAYQDILEELLVDISRQQYLMSHIWERPSIRYLFELRRIFDEPKKRKADQKVKPKVDDTETQNPILLHRLQNLRSRIAKERGLPAYCILDTKTLTAISNALPVTRQELLKIYGFGAKRYESCGEDILNLVREYRGSPSSPSENKKSIQATVQEEHRMAVTAFRSAQLLLQGKDIEAIAAERNLPEEIICIHLSYAIREKLIRPSQLTSRDKKKLDL